MMKNDDGKDDGLSQTDSRIWRRFKKALNVSKNP